jgi:hypothetical protein
MFSNILFFNKNLSTIFIRLYLCILQKTQKNLENRNKKEFPSITIFSQRKNASDSLWTKQAKIRHHLT